MNLSSVEEEVIFLNSIKQLIDSMVNHELFLLKGTDPDSSIFFESKTHQRFFNIALVDFLSYSDKKAPVKPNSYLGALRTISANPNFNINNSVLALKKATYTFCDWLNQEVIIETWLPTIDTQANIQITRLLFLKMCGDLSKHNILRSVGVAKELQNTLEKSGHKIKLEDAMLASSDFYERFHIDILNYHSSTIAEFLNNICWGIYEYLQPEFQRSLIWTDTNPKVYGFTYPEGVSNEFARHCYWNLMNEVRSEPYIRRFKVSKWLKLRY